MCLWRPGGHQSIAALRADGRCFPAGWTPCSGCLDDRSITCRLGPHTIDAPALPPDLQQCRVRTRPVVRRTARAKTPACRMLATGTRPVGGCGCVLRMVLDGRALELSRDFVDEHPGGSDVLFALRGRDCTLHFEAAGHSASARKWAAQYAVGSACKDIQALDKAGFGLPVGWALGCLSDIIAALGGPPASSQVDRLPLKLALVTVASAALTVWQLRACVQHKS